MDKHLNFFWQYGNNDIADENSINKLENNITRSFIVTFKSFSNYTKIKFINTLVNKNLLSYDEMYEYEYELQTFSLSAEVQSSSNKYLIGVCPNGDVASKGNNEIDFDKIVKLIEGSANNHDANPDATIIVKRKNKNILSLVFENKKNALDPKQLKRHFINYLGINNCFGDHFIIKNYYDFFDLFSSFEKEEYLVHELVQYITYTGNYVPNFNFLNNIDLNNINEKKQMLEQILGRVLDNVQSKLNIGFRRKQQGWGHIIDIGDTSKYCKMIGLVCEEQNNQLNVLLNIKFASSMLNAKEFYSDQSIDFNSIYDDNNIAGFFTFQWQHDYLIGTSESFFERKKYVEFFQSIIQTGFHQVGRNGIKELLNNMRNSGLQYSKTNDEVIAIINNIHSRSLNANKINYVPSLDINIRWDSKEINNYDIA